MSHFSFRAWAVTLLTLSLPSSPQYAEAGIIRRHEHDLNGSKLPPYLQSEWHTKNLAAPKMTVDEAMDYYFPLLKRTIDCPPEGGNGGDGGGTGPGGQAGVNASALWMLFDSKE